MRISEILLDHGAPIQAKTKVRVPQHEQRLVHRVPGQASQDQIPFLINRDWSY